MVFLAGMWSLALLVLRLFDKPGISGRGVAGNVGVQWGIFFALAAAGALAYAGSRMRSADLHTELHHRHTRQRVGPSERPRTAGEEPEPLTPAVVGAPSSRRAQASRAAPPSRPAPSSRPVSPAGPVPASRPATAAG